MLWPEVGAPHRMHQVYVFGNDEPNTWEDVTEPIEQKIVALKQHVSQIGDKDPSEMINECSAGTGKEKGLVHAIATGSSGWSDRTQLTSVRD